MTLIISYITKFGIVQASDSNLTSSLGNAGFGQKIFPIAHLNGSLAYSGAYSVNGKSVDSYINDFIVRSAFTVRSFKEFVNDLTNSLSSEMRPEEIGEPTIIHIAGYEEDEQFRNHVQH